MSKHERPQMSRAEYHDQKSDLQGMQPNQPKKKKSVLKKVGIVVLIALIAAGVYLGYAYFRTRSAANKTYDEHNKVTNPSVFDGKKPISILLLGTDTGAFGRTEKLGNTDTIIMATVDPKTKQTSLISIPRDTMAEMIGAEPFNVQKINAAYSIGGAKMTMNTVSSLLNVPVKYYAAINMAGLEKLVDLVGGVDVDVPFDFAYDGHSFKTGKMHINGAAALAYARMRYDDPENDYGRQKRQRQVIFSIVKNLVSLNTVAKLEGILDSVSANVKTNLTFDNMLAIGTNYRSAADNMKSDYLHGTPAMIGEASYQVMKTSELQRVSDLLRKQLGLEPETLDTNETMQNEMNKSFNWDAGDPNQIYTVYSKNNPGQVWDGTN